MPIDTSKLTAALRGLDERYESKDSVYEAIYVSDNGDGFHYVDVLNPDGTQGVRRLVRGRVRSWPGVLVRLSYHRKAYGPDELVIIGPSELAYGSSPAPSLLEPHGDDHGYNQIDECMTLYTWQIWPLRVQPSVPASMIAQVLPGVYFAEGSYRQTTATIDVDLTANLPVVSAWKYVSLSIDGAGSITVTNGSEGGAISPEDIPLPPAGEYPLGAVLLHINDTALGRDRFTADLRYILTPLATSITPFDITLDDGTGNSPSLCFVGGSNDDTICIYLDDDAIANNSDLVVELCATDADSQLIIRDSTPTDVAYIDADGNAWFDSHVAMGGVGVPLTTTVTRSEAVATGADVATSVLGRLHFDGAAYLTDHIGVEGSIHIGAAANRLGGALIGVAGDVVVDDSTAATNLVVAGVRGSIDVEDAGAALAIAGWYETPSVDTGTITDSSGIRIYEGTKGGAGTITTQYGLRIESMTIGTANWAIYSAGGDSYHSGNIRVGALVGAPSATLHVVQNPVAGAIPALIVDQRDVSEQCIQFTSSGSDIDINLFTIAVTGTPTAIWDESEDALTWNMNLALDDGAGDSPELRFVGGSNDDIFNIFLEDDAVAGDSDLVIKFPAADTDSQILFRDSGDVDVGYIDADGNVRFAGAAGIGLTGAVSAQLHVDQASTTAAIPVLYLDQADISEEMIEFNTTIGVGNAIEAVGGKTLTTTHFIKVTLPGPLTRYIPVGTIA